MKKFKHANLMYYIACNNISFRDKSFFQAVCHQNGNWNLFCWLHCHRQYQEKLETQHKGIDWCQMIYMVNQWLNIKLNYDI